MIGDGADLIAIERRRQKIEEGFDAQHDDDHIFGEISGAGAAYATLASRQIGSGLHAAEAVQPPAQTWRWERSWWKPSDDPLRNLVKAGALIAAEIDRLLREREDPDPNQPEPDPEPVEGDPWDFQGWDVSDFHRALSESTVHAMTFLRDQLRARVDGYYADLRDQNDELIEENHRLRARVQPEPLEPEDNFYHVEPGRGGVAVSFEYHDACREAAGVRQGQSLLGWIRAHVHPRMVSREQFNALVGEIASGMADYENAADVAVDVLRFLRIEITPDEGAPDGA